MASRLTIAAIQNGMQIDTASPVKQAGGPVSTATNAWGGNNLSLKLLEVLNVSASRVIGLGSGLGILDIACATRGALALATDLEDVMPLLQRNIDLNAAMLAASAGSIRCTALDWCRPLPKDVRQTGPFDMVFASDCIYWPHLFQPLVDTLSSLCALSPTAHVFLAMEARRSSELNFFALLDRAGFRWYRVDDTHAGHDALARSTGQSVGMFWCQRASEGPTFLRTVSSLPGTEQVGDNCSVMMHDSAEGVDVTSLAQPVEDAAAIIWEYHTLRHPLRRSDVILVLCSNDPRVAVHGARLWLQGWAPLLVFSGGVGKLTEGLYGGLSEGAYFSRIAESMGVPSSSILVEGASTNTGENIVFSARIMQEAGVKDAPRRLLLVQKPFMERRTLATFEAQSRGIHFWQSVETLTVSSPAISWAAYPRTDLPGLSKRMVLEVMAGDLQRIAVYPSKGFQSVQTVPSRVWDALSCLVSHGLTGHLILDRSSNRGGDQGQALFEGLLPDQPRPSCVVP